MKTTIIPAQITTVEDKIAGNLSMTQIVILMLPIFFGTFLFTFIPPTMKVSLYKIPPVIVVLLVSILLSIRIKGKVVLHWIQILFAYSIRPRCYIFNKNDLYLRDIPQAGTKEEKTESKKFIKKEIAISASKFDMTELKKLESLIRNPRYTFSLKPGKNGKLDVLVFETNPH